MAAAPDQMDPILDLLNQRPREDWSWQFEADAIAQSAINGIALCNAALVTYSDSASVRRFLTKWHFSEIAILRGFHTQGFVARQSNILIVAFRGTEPTNAVDWLTDVNYHQARYMSKIPGRIHGGWTRGLEEVRPAMIGAIRQLAKADQPRIYITGHSLGGALAVLAAAVLEFEESQPVSAVYTYGQPRVGDPEFSQAFDTKLRASTFRYVNDQDIVPHLPLPKMPGRPDFHLGRSMTELSTDLANSLQAVRNGENFDHVGQLNLLLPDGKLSNDPGLWREREVGLEAEILNLLRGLPNRFRFDLRRVLDRGRRVLDHDPLNGYLKRLENLPH
jgi:hypothetical protein